MQTFTCDAPKIFSKTEVALVDEEITADQPGRVKFQTTYWPAILFRDYGITLSIPVKKLQLWVVRGLLY